MPKHYTSMLPDQIVSVALLVCIVFAVYQIAGPAIASDTTTLAERIEAFLTNSL